MMVDARQYKILVLDDSQAVLKQLYNSLDLDKYIIHTADNVLDAKDILRRINPDLLIVSVEQGSHAGESMMGIDILNQIKKERFSVAVIAVSSDHSPVIAATAIRAGATDFLHLPINPERLASSIEQSMSCVAGELESNKLNHPLFNESEFGFIGAGQSMLEVSKLIISAAKSNASVFITGENGTGKDVCAELIHRLSKRKNHKLVPLNCAAIPHALAESELFGHVKGAFTGAHEERDGLATLSDEGTLFLDEIGDMNIDLQTKLLRFVQTGTFNKVGCSKLEQVSTRFICATNREPVKQIEKGDFREDLFYRLNVIQIHLPPLRNRGEDVLTFARNFLKTFAKEENKSFHSLSRETEILLLSYSWPGNVRELQNVIRSIVVLHDGDVVIPSMLPLDLIREKGERRRRSDESLEAPKLDANLVSEGTGGECSDDTSLILTLDQTIENTVKRAIRLCDGNIVEAARQLDVSASTLYRKLKKRQSVILRAELEVLTA